MRSRRCAGGTVDIRLRRRSVWLGSVRRQAWLRLSRGMHEIARKVPDSPPEFDGVVTSQLETFQRPTQRGRTAARVPAIAQLQECNPGGLTHVTLTMTFVPSSRAVLYALAEPRSGWITAADATDAGVSRPAPRTVRQERGSPAFPLRRLPVPRLSGTALRGCDRSVHVGWSRCCSQTRNRSSDLRPR